MAARGASAASNFVLVKGQKPVSGKPKGKSTPEIESVLYKYAPGFGDAISPRGTGFAPVSASRPPRVNPCFYGLYSARRAENDFEADTRIPGAKPTLFQAPNPLAAASPNHSLF